MLTFTASADYGSGWRNKSTRNSPSYFKHSTEILKPLRKEKLKIAVPNFKVVLIFFLMRNIYNPYIKKLKSMFLFFCDVIYPTKSQ